MTTPDTHDTLLWQLLVVTFGAEVVALTYGLDPSEVERRAGLVPQEAAS